MRLGLSFLMPSFLQNERLKAEGMGGGGLAGALRPADVRIQEQHERERLEWTTKVDEMKVGPPR
jgi:hypothetical protein